jgi:hypothetical protein
MALLSGEAKNMGEAIALHGASLHSYPPSHPYVPVSLDNLVDLLQTRYEQLGELKDLGEVIELHRG